MGKVLECLRQTGDGVTVANIAEACHITKNAAKGALARLLKKNLVVKTGSPPRILWGVTQGRTLLEVLQPGHMIHDDGDVGVGIVFDSPEHN